ncbi:hypothetical protein LOD99_3123 [Oopsacas minuta]|uniref:Uncharacterized protein n=1 Tax=Oopsacas minuta TaxID=111878 RepID=A0AAV7JYE8_9METZ|nr:hypothetical protein LOD99_3123 [Oopsacas minuta]
MVSESSTANRDLNLIDFIRTVRSRKVYSKESDVSISESTPNSFPLLTLSHPCLNSFLPIITGLAEVHNVHGELLILKAVSSWLPRCKDIVLAHIASQPNFIYDDFMLEFGASCSFLSDLLEQIKLITTVVKILMSRDGFDGFPDTSFFISNDNENDIDTTHTEDEEIGFSTYVSNTYQINSQICTISVS